jgi:hypothetical protein
MQTWEAITSRCNVRSFAGRPIPATDLDQILEAGRRSPSSPEYPAATTASRSSSVGRSKVLAEGLGSGDVGRGIGPALGVTHFICRAKSDF